MNTQQLRDSGNPFIRVDGKGYVLEINQAFTNAFGWTDEELVGKSMKQILPPDMALSHAMCFGRFLPDHGSNVLGHPLELPTRCVDDTLIDCTHFIIAENNDGVINLGATITPLPAKADKD